MASILPFPNTLPNPTFHKYQTPYSTHARWRRKLHGGNTNSLPKAAELRLQVERARAQDITDCDPGSWESMEGLLHCSVNSTPLSPISFLERAAKVCGDRTSLVYGSLKYSWAETHQRCLKLASALTHLGISCGDVVATLAPNVPAMYELHFAVPIAGAILCTLNSRLDAAMASTLLEHSQAKILFVDYQLLEIAQGALDLLGKRARKLPILVLINDLECSSTIDFTSVI